MSDAGWEYVEDETADSPPLGEFRYRVLSVGEAYSKNEKPAVVGLMVVGGLLLLVCWVWRLIAKDHLYPNAGMVLGIGCLVLAGVFAVLNAIQRMWLGVRNWLDISGNGVVLHQKDRAPLEMQFDEIVLFTYAHVNVPSPMFLVGLRTQHGTALTRTDIVVQMTATDGRYLVFRTERTGRDKGMQWLRTRLGTRMAEAWWGRIQAGGRVHWFGNLTFEADGLSVKVSDNPEDDVSLAWNEVVLHQSPRGWVSISARTTAMQIGTIPDSATNFLPGCLLIQERQNALAEQRRQELEGPDGAEPRPGEVRNILE